VAYDPHTLVTFGGTLTEITGQDEIWQCGVRGVNNPGDGPVDAGQLSNLVTAIATQVSATPNLLGWFQGQAGDISNSARLAWVKAANIGADGKYTSPPATYHYAVPGVGPSDGQVPSFMSLCYTWTTARLYGRKLRYGRIYPPNFGIPIVAGSASVADAQAIFAAQSAVKCLGALAQSASEYHFQPCVVSPNLGHEAITGVRVGNVYDVHRSRKDAVAETYQALAYP
jgi:hypothetical protein